MSIQLLESATSILSSQLNYFHQHKTKFLQAYYPKDSNAYRRADQALTVYAMIVATVLEDSVPDALDAMVFIGSRVEVELDFGSKYRKPTVHTCQIVFPHMMRENETEWISFLSPVGMQLILANKGDYLTIDTPDKIYRAYVKDFSFTGIGGHPERQAAIRV